MPDLAMPDLVSTPARVASRTIKPIASGWTKSIKTAVRIGWLRGMMRSQRLRSRRTRVISVRAPEVAAAVLVGAGAEYLLDPADGKRRRHMLRDRGLALVRRTGHRGAAQARYYEGKAEGAVHEATSTPSAPPDDLTL